MYPTITRGLDDMTGIRNSAGMTDMNVDLRGPSAAFQDGYMFHPFEISICGYSNSGKTTLITRLIENLSSEFDIGYIKYDVHKFEIDKEGKDTLRVWSSGASHISISDSHHSAYIHKEPPTQREIRSAFNGCDFVFLEGLKKARVNKLVLIDDKKKILESVSRGEINNIIGFAGPEKAVKGLPVDAPYFNRDDVPGIADFIRQHLFTLAAKVPLFGLVLTGGDSRRMNRDKALLDYHGRPQAEVIYGLLSEVCKQVYISSKKDQWKGKSLGKLPEIQDVFLGLGPLSGILSAMHTHPKAAWLVVACDLPYVNHETIETLVKNRNPFKMATCFKSALSHLPEPLCSVYEPKIRIRLLENLGIGNLSPRDIFMNSSVKTVDQTERENLENVNSEEEYKKAKSKLGEGAGL
jgi:molybdopterin-guanine dinucleotide biosynthesis protein MobB